MNYYNDFLYKKFLSIYTPHPNPLPQGERELVKNHYGVGSVIVIE